MPGFWLVSITSAHTRAFVFCFVWFAQFRALFFYSLHTYLIKIPLKCENQGAIIRSRKRNFQSPFHFLISLFSWTPRDRLVIAPGALHLWGCPHGQFVLSCVVVFTPLGTARYLSVVQSQNAPFVGMPPWAIRARLCGSLYTIGYRSVSIHCAVPERSISGEPPVIMHARCRGHCYFP